MPSAAALSVELRRNRLRDAGIPVNITDRDCMLRYPEPQMRAKLLLSRHTPDFVLALETFSEVVIAELAAFALDAWQIQLPEIRYRIDWSLRRVRSWGGTYKAGWRDEVLPQTTDPDDWRVDGGGVSLVGAGMPEDLESASAYQEYPAFRYDREIGSLEGTGRDRWRALLCHEVAHVVDHHLAEDTPAALVEAMGANPAVPTGKLRGHDHRWQTIYRLFRRQLGLVAPHEDRRPSCSWCGERFEPRRVTALFCSPKCRVAAHRAEKKAKAVTIESEITG